MSVTSGFFNSVNGDRRYDARQMTALFNGIINDGIFANIGTAFKVTANGNNAVTVGIGRAWFNSTWVDNDAVLPLTLDVSEVLLNRYDAVVIEVDESDAVRAGSIKVIAGTPSSTPAYPTLIKTNDVHQYPLAYIYRAAGTTAVTQANITNAVGTSAAPYITGILQVQDIDNIVAQWQDEWAQWFAKETTEAEQNISDKETEINDWFSTTKTDTANWISDTEAEFTTWSIEQKAEFDDWSIEHKNEFDAWFADIQSALEGDVASNLLNKITNLENGTTPAGDSKTLGGHDSDYFATRTDGVISSGLLNKAFTLASGVFHFILSNYTDTDIPDGWKYSTAMILKRNDTSIVVVLFDESINSLNINSYNGVTWTGWDTVLSSKGGKLTGGIDIVAAIPYIDLHYGSDETLDYTTRIYEDGKGVLGIRNGADPGKILKVDTTKLSGVNDIIHTGNINNHALPLTGGIISDNAVTPLTLNSKVSSDTRILIGFNRESVKQGYLGFNGVNIPAFVTDDGVPKELLHVGNYTNHVLPKSGGRMTDGSEIGFAPWNSASCAVGTAFYNYGSTTRSGGYSALFNNGAINCLSMAVSSTPWDVSTGLSITASNVKWKNQDVLHKGNSAAVVISSSTPSDTSALWVY